MTAGSDARVELHVDDVAYGGDGVARRDGKVCFVPGALPGETVLADILKDRGAFARTVLREVLTPSPDRIPPACPLAFRPISTCQAPPEYRPAVCPGCCYQHAAYDAEVRLKHRQLQSLLDRQAHCTPDLCLPPVSSPRPLAYRNKLVLHARKQDGRMALGYFMDDNTTVVDVPACPLAVTPLNDLLRNLRDTPGWIGRLPDGKPLTLRHTPRDRALWWFGRASERDVWLVEDGSLGPISAPRDSFFQVNPAVSDLLVRRIVEMLQQRMPEAVVDLFCGVGVFALAAAGLGIPTVIGVDADGPGLRAADYNARQRGLANVKWIAATALKAVAGLAPDLAGKQATVIADPPRSGLGREMVRRLASLQPTRVLYVSCAADTMARDVAWFMQAGYTVTSSHVFDMFPRTAHFESLTELTRED